MLHTSLNSQFFVLDLRLGIVGLIRVWVSVRISIRVGMPVRSMDRMPVRQLTGERMFRQQCQTKFRHFDKLETN